MDINTKKENQRRAHLRRKYGISLEQYDELLKRQNYSCAICQKHESEFNTRLAVEHNHRTLEIHGLCCSYCNRYVIGRHLTPEIAQRVADYLKTGTGWFVPKKTKTKKRKPVR